MEEISRNTLRKIELSKFIIPQILFFAFYFLVGKYDWDYGFDLPVRLFFGGMSSIITGIIFGVIFYFMGKKSEYENDKILKLPIFFIILSVILFLVPKYIAPVCGPKEDGSHMSCYFSGNMVMKLAGAIFIITLLMIILSKIKIVKILGSVAVIVISAYVYMIPNGVSGLHNEMGKPFGVCKVDTMLCHVHHTFEIATGIAVVIGLLMVFSLISTFLKKED